jgi:hypothetical protein
VDGAEHKLPYAGKRVKLFKRKIGIIGNKNSKKGLYDVYDSNLQEELAYRWCKPEVA